jgi:nitrilase
LRKSGAEIISLPSAFVKETGDDHWEPLVRARAIETQTWILAANQGGRHSRKQVTSGNSMIADPWGITVNSIRKGEGVIIHKIDSELTGRVRSRMPVMNHRREDLFNCEDR